MDWTILADADYAEWVLAQPPAVRRAILAKLILLGSEGPNLGRPVVDTLKGSTLENLKELRVQVKAAPYRILFAFDPKRRAILLVGGNKAIDKRWYRVNIPIAEERYARHLGRLAAEDEAEAEGES